jgi:hypothetical protein
MNVNRRNFLKRAGAAGAVPLFNIGCAGFGRSRAAQLADGAPIRLALIGCGMFMRTHMQRIRDYGGIDVIAMCDPDPHMVEAARKAGRGYNFSTMLVFADYREMFDKVGGELDAVMIASTNHHHALPALTAIRRGIHVFLEKPLSHTMEEALMLADEAKEHGVITQGGNYGHCTDCKREVVKAIKRGDLGEITDVYCFSDRVNSMPFRPPSSEPPEGMDWDLWCGGSPTCEYYGLWGKKKNRYGMHPHDWHSWIEYGNGSIGNMGMHIMDAAVMALDLWKKDPYQIDVIDVAWPNCPGAWAMRDAFDFRFPERPGFHPVTLHWRDGMKDGVVMDEPWMDGKINMCTQREYTNFPQELVELEKKYGVKNPIPKTGCVFVGTEGMIYEEFHSIMRYYPESGRFKDINIDTMAYQGERIVHEFFDAIRGKAACSDSFDYAVPLCKLTMLGNMAAFAGKGSFKWNGRKADHAAANAHASMKYRTGWGIHA